MLNSIQHSIVVGQPTDLSVHLQRRKGHLNGEDMRKNYKIYRGINALLIHILQNSLT